MTGLLEADGLLKAFQRRTIVDEVTLRVNEGEIVGLLGPNGAGKTTIFKILLGLTKPDQGTVRYGEVLNGLPLFERARRGLGYLPQGASVFRGMTVEDNLLAILEARGKSRPMERADELLTEVGLLAYRKQKAKTLSGGERRKLEFARALCSDPRMLLVDEPFSGIDPLAAVQMSEALVRLARNGVGVLLTDHRTDLTLSTCDRLYLLIAGRIVEEGKPQQIAESLTARSFYLGGTVGQE